MKSLLMQLPSLLKDGKKRKEKLQKINTVLLESLQGIKFKGKKNLINFLLKRYSLKYIFVLLIHF